MRTLKAIGRAEILLNGSLMNWDLNALVAVGCLPFAASVSLSRFVHIKHKRIWYGKQRRASHLKTWKAQEFPGMIGRVFANGQKMGLSKWDGCYSSQHL